MKRSRWAFPFAALASGLAAAATAQSAREAPLTAAQAVDAAAEAYGPPDTRRKEECPPRAPGDEIVVCAQTQDQEQFRVRSSSDLDPTGAGARGGVPRAPDVGTVYPGAVVARGCFIPPCPPPMPPIIDLKAIPEAPPGSDADRVARGLAPRGDASGDSGADNSDRAVRPPG
ncbi:hypothetical protein N0B51_03270 [Tsuneonella sp. YG55]|uniref:Uncharacterized protein n=1 Tax=Tsuneonella litorea TaxID=2976475 RepID=A0A9X2W153_9SPHN|nr:hypothetical protein [Tsuneonella litorea]MCT2557995.1 hypothetical protein [Tsuneonella litorea]